MARASPARTWRPVQIISLARAGPIRRGRRWVGPPPGNTPRAVSGTPRRGRSPARRRAQAAADPGPATPLHPLHELLSGGIGIDRAVGHRSRHLLEPLALAEPAGPGVEALDHDGAQLLPDAPLPAGIQAPVGLQEGPVVGDGLPQIV